MNIVFNYEIFALQKYGGISRYYVELAAAMRGHVDVRIVAPYYINKYLDDTDRINLVTLNKSRFIRNRFYDITDTVNYFYTKLYLRKHPVQIYHLTYYTENDLNIPGVKKVITIHDMIYELFPEGLPEQDYVIGCKKKYISEADLIIAVSENTKADLLRLYPEAINKISVVYHGVDASAYYNIKPYNSVPFILYVGNRAGYKNFNMLLDIYNNTKELSDNYDLICFGGGPFNSDEMKKVNQLREGKVRHIEGDDQLLGSLYKSAMLFIYPSDYEGFGMPVLEAMAAGCPVVCANSSSLPEVAGDAAVYFKKNDKEDLKNTVLNVLTDDALRQSLIKKGLDRIRIFTWEACAEKTIAAYNKILK